MIYFLFEISNDYFPVGTECFWDKMIGRISNVIGIGFHIIYFFKEVCKEIVNRVFDMILFEKGGN